MKTDFLEYEKALEKHFRTLEARPALLCSWNFYGEYCDFLKTAVFDAQQLTDLAKGNRWTGQWNFADELQKGKSIVVTDVNLKIVFASQNIVKMSGYSPEEITGYSPKMFQGEETSERDIEEIRTAIHNQKPFEKTIANYKKNGEIYLCHIRAFPVFNSKKQLANFIAFEEVA